MSKPAKREDVPETAGTYEPGRRGDILAAAASVFAERGYDAGSMRAIAEQVGVTEPALYRHFAGKEELFTALVRDAAERTGRDALVLLSQIGPDSIRSGVLTALAARRRALTELAPVIRTALTAAPHHPRIRSELRAALAAPVYRSLLAKAAEVDDALGVENGNQTRQARVRALIALVFGYLATSTIFEDEPDEAVVDALLRVMGWEDTPDR